MTPYEQILKATLENYAQVLNDQVFPPSPLRWLSDPPKLTKKQRKKVRKARKAEHRKEQKRIEREAHKRKHVCCDGDHW